MIKPTWSLWHITFGRNPIFTSTITRRKIRGVYLSWDRRQSISPFWCECSPGSFGSKPLFIADPTHIRSYIGEYHCHGLMLTHNWPCFFFPFVIGNSIYRTTFIASPIVAIPTISTIMPGGKQRPIACHQFAQLLTISIGISRSTVSRVIAIPRRKIDAKLHSRTMCGLHKVAHHIALPIFPRGFRDIIIRSLCRPQTKTIVVFCHTNQSFETCRSSCLRDLIRVKSRRVKNFGICISKTPFLILECRGCVVNQSIQLHLM